jgi:hypothetical protein
VGKLVKGKEKKGKRVKDYREKRRKEVLLTANGTKIETNKWGQNRDMLKGKEDGSD